MDYCDDDYNSCLTKEIGSDFEKAFSYIKKSAGEKLIYIHELKDKYGNLLYKINPKNLTEINNQFYQIFDCTEMNELEKIILTFNDCNKYFSLIGTIHKIFFVDFSPQLLLPLTKNFFYSKTLKILKHMHQKLMQNFCEQVIKSETMGQVSTEMTNFMTFISHVEKYKLIPGKKFPIAKYVEDFKKQTDKLAYSEIDNDLIKINTILDMFAYFDKKIANEHAESIKFLVFRKCADDYERALFDIYYYENDKSDIYNLQKYLELFLENISENNVKEKLDIINYMSNVDLLYLKEIENIFIKIIKNTCEHTFSNICGKMFFKHKEDEDFYTNPFYLRVIYFSEFFSIYEAYLKHYLENKILENSNNFLEIVKNEKTRLEKLAKKVAENGNILNLNNYSIYRYLCEINEVKNDNTSFVLIRDGFFTIRPDSEKTFIDDILIEDHLFRKSFNNFQKMYFSGQKTGDGKKKFKGNKLDFILENSTCVLEAMYPKGKKELKMPILYGFVLLHIDKYLNLSPKQIATNLNMDLEIVNEIIFNLNDLIRSKKDVTNVYEINPDYISKTRSIVIKNIKKRPEEKLNCQYINAHIVKLLKKNSSMDFEDLFSKVKNIFTEMSLDKFKHNIQDLINKEFVQQNNTTLVYLV